MKENFLPSKWEQRFEDEINAFFDRAIERLPGFIDKDFRSFSKVMKRNLSITNTFGDLAVGLRNIASGVSEAVGGKNFEKSTYTEDEIAAAFEREVLDPKELEALLGDLFDEFEKDLWSRCEEKIDPSSNLAIHEQMCKLVDRKIGHDAKFAQAVRSGIQIGLPTTLGYFFFREKENSVISAQDMSGFQRIVHLFRGKKEDKEEGLLQDLAGEALGITGVVLGALVVGGLFEYAINSVRDLKGNYIRKINTARYILLYGTDPSNPSGRGILHIVRALERKFGELPPGFAAETFKLWLESGIQSPSTQTLQDSKQYDYPSDANDVTIQEALELVYDADIEKVAKDQYEVTIPAESSPKVEAKTNGLGDQREGNN